MAVFATLNMYYAGERWRGERGHMLRNAPHLVHDQQFVVPAYSYASLPYYGFG